MLTTVLVTTILFYLIFLIAIQLQFDRTSYTANETDGLVEELIRVTKGGVISEQVLEGAVNIVDLSPNTAQFGKQKLQWSVFKLF